MHAFNSVKFKKKYDLYFEFIPRFDSLFFFFSFTPWVTQLSRCQCWLFCFLLCFFLVVILTFEIRYGSFRTKSLLDRLIFFNCLIGYMVLLIVVKWLRNWSAVQPNCPTCPGTIIFSSLFFKKKKKKGNGASAAPYIISIMIDMFLSPLNFEDTSCTYMLGCPFQPIFEFLLLFIALLCVPVMLLAKPYFLWRENKKDPKPDFALGELMVHQVIESIEFVLGNSFYDIFVH